jgi:hypothetical protein
MQKLLIRFRYVTAASLNLSETLYSITAKGRAALHETEGNDEPYEIETEPGPDRTYRLG